MSQATLFVRCGEAGPAVLAALVARGFVAPEPVEGRHAHTALGRSWLETRSVTSIRLETARRALTALRERAENMVARADSLFLPQRIEVFGSVLEAPANLTPVEVGVLLAPVPDARSRAEEAIRLARSQSGARRDAAGWLAARERGAWAHLGKRSPALRLFRLGEQTPRGVELFPNDEVSGLLARKKTR